MKKYFYLLVLALVPMCFTACGDDDDDDAAGVAGVETLYGGWQQTHRVAWEGGAWHHDNDVDAEEAEYLLFDANGSCIVYGGEGIFSWNDNGTTYSYTYDEDSKTLRIGNLTVTVEVLSKGTLKLKYHGWSHADGDYSLITYKKIDASIFYQ